MSGEALLADVLPAAAPLGPLGSSSSGPGPPGAADPLALLRERALVAGAGEALLLAFVAHLAAEVRALGIQGHDLVAVRLRQLRAAANELARVAH